MAQDLKCAHCGEPLKARDKVCPRCGAPVDEDRSPKTIYELRSWCARHNVPLEKIRFFVGEDCREARAFGIYQEDGGDFVVYKNKADGSRAVRYKGPDEAHAVQELYQKLLSEITVRRQNKRVQRGEDPKRSKQTRRKNTLAVIAGILLTVVIAVAAAAVMIALKFDRGPDRGYYRYKGETYYSQNDSWYAYDEEISEWVPAIIDEEFESDPETYYMGRSFDESYGVGDFSESGWYSDPGAFSDWDDDDWDDWGDDDWDDWDDFDTDWDSDW